MSIFDLAYNEAVLLMWFFGFIGIEIGGAVGWAIFKSTAWLLIFQVLAFIIMMIFFPALFLLTE